MANFSNTYSDNELDREMLMESIIKTKSPADAAREIIGRVFLPLVDSLEDTCPVDCDYCRD